MCCEIGEEFQQSIGIRFNRVELARSSRINSVNRLPCPAISLGRDAIK